MYLAYQRICAKQDGYTGEKGPQVIEVENTHQFFERFFESIK